MSSVSIPKTRLVWADITSVYQNRVRTCPYPNESWWPPYQFRPRWPLSLKLANCSGDIIVHKGTRRHKGNFYSCHSYSGGPTIRHYRWEIRHRTYGGETLPIFQIRTVTDTYNNMAITKFGSTQDSNSGPPDLHPYMLATRPAKYLAQWI